MSNKGVTLHETFKRAMILQQAGRVEEAAHLYQEVLASQPKEINALHLLGCCHLQSGKYSASLELFDATLRFAPSFATAHCNRAVALRRLGRLEEGLISVDRAIVLQPGSFDAHCNRCAILNDLNRPDEALKSGDQAIALHPGGAQAHNNRGEALRRLKRYDDAIASFDAALQIEPRFEQACINRGLAFVELNEYEEALNSVEQALAIQTDAAEKHYLRGKILWRLKRMEDGVAALDTAIKLQPGLAMAYCTRGEILHEIGLTKEALTSYEKAITLQPELAIAHGARANLLCGQGRYEEALASYDRTLELDPDMAEAYANRGVALIKLKRYAESLVNLDRALFLNPELPWLRGVWLHCRMQSCIWENIDEHWRAVLRQVDLDLPVANPFTLLATPAMPEQLQRTARKFSDTCYPCIEKPLWNGERYTHDRIRIGYLSADFHSHATTYLMAELFERHDRNLFEIIAFSFGPPSQDACRERLTRAFDRFIDVSGASDSEIARLARELEIDIAVDLKGYTQDLRTRIFAWRPAPIQVNYLGYPGTMGSPYIDYLIADPVLIPPEQRDFYDEKIAYLPDSYQPNDSTKAISDEPMTRTDHGLPETGFIFCCFNNSFKITPDVFDIWMRILKRVEGSVLWLLEGSPVAAANLRIEASRRGIAPERLVFAPRMDLDRHLARHRLADLFLDTFNYNAHTTGSDALWAGLPVLTCPGGTLASRVAASLNAAVGLPEMNVVNQMEYEALAIAYAEKNASLAALRARLADNLPTAPLFDTVRYTRNLETLYQIMHTRYQHGLAPDHLFIN